MSLPVSLRVVPYQPRLLLAQILDVGSYDKTGGQKELVDKDKRGKESNFADIRSLS